MLGAGWSNRSSVRIAVVGALLIGVMSGCQAVEERAPVGAAGNVGGAGLTAAATADTDYYALAVDDATHALWAPVLEDDGPGALERVDTRTLAVQSWPLPATGYSGQFERIAVATDGAVWIGAGYTLIRFDPTTGASRSLALPLAVPGELPSATDRSNIMAGTYISALAAEGTGIVIARANVPYLARFDASLTQTQTLPSPAGPNVVWDMAIGSGGSMYLATGAGSAQHAWTMASTGGTPAEVEASGTFVRAEGDSALLSNGDGPPAWLTARATATASTLTGATSSAAASLTVSRVTFSDDLGDWAVPDPRGGITVWRVASGDLAHVVDGAIVDQVALPDQPNAGAPILDPHVPYSPARTNTPRPIQLNAFVTDATGATWVVPVNLHAVLRFDLR